MIYYEPIWQRPQNCTVRIRIRNYLPSRIRIHHSGTERRIPKKYLRYESRTLHLRLCISPSAHIYNFILIPFYLIISNEFWKSFLNTTHKFTRCHCWIISSVRTFECRTISFLLYIFWWARVCFATPFLMSPIKYIWEMSRFEPRELP
jgi:hypothetical protein